MNVIILAAGFGTRLYPLTRFKPKALLEVNGKTLLDHLMEKLYSLRLVDEIVIVSNSRFFKDFCLWRSRCNYQKKIRIIDNGVNDPEKRGGAISDLSLGIKSCRAVGDDSLVLCGDNYFDFPLGYFLLPCLGHRKSAFIGIYDLKDRAEATRFGVLAIDGDGKIIDFEEKPANPKSSLVSLGVYYFPAQFCCRLHEYLSVERLNPDRIGDFIAWLARKETLYGVLFDGHWFDVGDIESYEKVKNIFESKEICMR